MYTTNTSSNSDPATYANLSRECAELSRISLEMERLAANNPRFDVDPEFISLKSRLRAKYMAVSSLAGAI